MWRHQSFQEILDSDQSISDGDDEEQDPENYVSLAGTSAHNKNDLGFSSEDEVEVPEFHKRNLDIKNIRCDPVSSKAKDSTHDSDEWSSDVKKGIKMLVESIPDEKNGVPEVCDLYKKEHEKQFEPCPSSAVHKELGRQNHLMENARWPMLYSEAKIPGGKCKTMQRSSSHLLHKQRVSRSVWKEMEANPASDDELLDEAEASELWPMDKTKPMPLGDNDGETMKPSLVLPMEPALRQDDHKRSMAELLDNLQGKIRNPRFKSKKGTYMLHGRRGKGLVQRPVNKSTSSSGKILTGDEDPCELMHDESSTDNEDNATTTEIVAVESGRKTMADKFQEAFGSASSDNRRPFVVPKQSRTGLFGRLQSIMQEQKEQDAEFLKKVQTEVWPKDEAECIDVKILSRAFDAKLIVCQCSLLENEESSLQNPQQENFGKIWTVIFNTRVCDDVDLEVGSLIRISPPWKEVQILRGGEIIILTSYFSQIHT